MTGQEKGDLLR